LSYVKTTHYIEEAEEMADRVGVINNGKLLLVEEKATLMQRLGKKQLTLNLTDVINEIPSTLSDLDLALNAGGSELVYTYDSQGERTGIATLLQKLSEQGIRFSDLNTEQSSLEQIFIQLLHEPDQEKQEKTS